MKKISDTDPNFRLNNIKSDNIVFHNVMMPPFKVYGLKYDNTSGYVRMPDNIASKISSGVYTLNKCTAGGRIRFSTDSQQICLNIEYSNVSQMPHFALSGSGGFDLYEYGGIHSAYLGSFIPPDDKVSSFNSQITLDSKKERQLLINFPTYSCIKNVTVGLTENATLGTASEYCNKKPVVFYGSSITQGGCSSRPGTTYEALISVSKNIDYINLGFSGNAKGEPEMAEYISNLDPSLFFFDYDYNAPDTNHLKNTHEAFFMKFRKTRPFTPVIMMSRPKYILTKEEEYRKEIIKNTYFNALSRGDKNVYFIDGQELMKICKDEGTVDNCHPTDLGFFSMAQTIIEFMEINNIRI